MGFCVLRCAHDSYGSRLKAVVRIESALVQFESTECEAPGHVGGHGSLQEDTLSAKVHVPQPRKFRRLTRAPQASDVVAVAPRSELGVIPNYQFTEIMVTSH